VAGWRQALGVVLLAVAAGLAGVIAGSVLTRRPPPWLKAVLLDSEAGRALLARLERTGPGTQPDVTIAQPGDPRPDPALVDLDGRPRSLGEWQGRLLLVNFWASWCGPCREEMPALDRFHAGEAADGVQVISIAVDDPGAVREFLRDLPVRYPVLLPATGSADPSLAFGNTRGALPYSVLIGRDGRLLARKLGRLDEAALAEWIRPYR